MSTSSQEDSANEGQQRRHAGFLIRLVAGLADILVMGVPILVLVLAFIIFGSDAGEITGFDWEYTDADGATQSTRVSFSIADLVQIVVMAGATVWLWVNWDGRTPGKKLTHTRIVTWPGYRPLSYRTSVVRMLVAVASAIPLMAGYLVISLMIALRADKRGYHDLMAGTCVVYDAPE